MTCFSISEWFWHAKNYLVKSQKFWDWGDPPTPFGKNSKKIPYFFWEAPSGPLTSGYLPPSPIWFERIRPPSYVCDNFGSLSALTHLLQNLIPAPISPWAKKCAKNWLKSGRLGYFFSGRRSLSPGNRLLQLVLWWQRREDNLGPVTDTDPPSLRYKLKGNAMVNERVVTG